MRWNGILFAGLAAVALPLFAQAQFTPACGGAALPPAMTSLEGTSVQAPLAPAQRLFYQLSGLEEGARLDLRYLVDGKPYLTEIVDLSTARVPESDRVGSLPPGKLASGLELESPFGGDLIIELLALRPDLARQLHQLEGADAAILIDVSEGGRLLDSFSFVELRQRSAELAKSGAGSLVVLSRVSGPGDSAAEKLRRSVAFTYLESCTECTSSTPCNTECGYDPGKGGPVTCGEYGAPCLDTSTCPCESGISYYWTSFYLYRVYPNGQLACLRSQHYPYSVHEVLVHEWRRDRIRRSTVCPNCPACTNCYTREQVVAYETTLTGCWNERFSPCQNGTRPCCSTLCFVGSSTPCNRAC